MEEKPQEAAKKTNKQTPKSRGGGPPPRVRVPGRGESPTGPTARDGVWTEGRALVYTLTRKARCRPPGGSVASGPPPARFGGGLRGWTLKTNKNQTKTCSGSAGRSHCERVVDKRRYDIIRGGARSVCAAYVRVDANSARDLALVRTVFFGFF